MKKKRQVLHRILRAAELPQDIDPHLLSIHWCGRSELMIEQHRGILKFSDEAIRLCSEQGILMILGKELLMDRLTETSAHISGNIQTLSFEDKT